ncbi:MAG: hypothetical protein BYD32DRAFT_405486 [Podila humilis]|nr:MAG: hypothetical protein BYD32DRAFT_405486 [Podila humilis]
MSHTKNSTFSHRGAPSKQITLFGICDGDRSEHVFSVKVDPSDTVDDLKKLVKAAKHPKFDHMPADELTLCCVAIPYLPGIDESQFDHLFPKRLLHPMETLSDVFGESVPKNIIHFRVVDTRWGPMDTETFRAKVDSYLSIALNLGFIMYYFPMGLVIFVFSTYFYKTVGFSY